MGKNPIWLVGMSGAGKSVVGPPLARRLGRHFSDTDAEVENAAGRSIREIFESEGEAAFRGRERAAIDAKIESGDVVALGGGAIAQPGVSQRLAAAGTVVYLKAEPERLLSRLGNCATRPLLSDLAPRERLARIVALLAERRVAYESAAVVVETDRLSVDRVVEEVAALVESVAGAAFPGRECP